MHLRASFVLVIAVCSASACGGGNVTQPTPNPLPVADAGANANAPLHERIASNALQAAWPIAEPFALFYADMQSAFAPELVLAKLALALASMTTSHVPAAQMNCLRDTLLAAKELVSGAREGSLLVARLDRARAPQLRACFGANVDTVSAQGADDAWSGLDRDIAATSGDLFFMGPKSLVESALTRRGEGAQALRQLALSGDQVARLHLESGAIVDATFSLSAHHLGGNVELQLHSSDEAESLAEKANHLSALVPATATADHDALVRLASAVHATHDKKHMSAVFSLDEPVTDQLRDLSAVAALAQKGVEDYLIAAKQAEARSTVGVIARDIVTSFEAEPMPPAKKPTKLASFPAVPAAVPRGVKYRSKPDDWKAWAPIRFEMDEPQLYQYEVRAARDGQTATVIARGDLNGDGKTSLFELTLKLDHGHVIAAPTISETNPTE